MSNCFSNGWNDLQTFRQKFYSEKCKNIRCYQLCWPKTISNSESVKNLLHNMTLWSRSVSKKMVYWEDASTFLHFLKKSNGAVWPWGRVKKRFQKTFAFDAIMPPLIIYCTIFSILSSLCLLKAEDSFCM